MTSNISLDKEAEKIEKDLIEILGKENFNRSAIYKKAINSELSKLCVSNLDEDLIQKKIDVETAKVKQSNVRIKHNKNLLVRISEAKQKKKVEIKDKKIGEKEKLREQIKTFSKSIRGEFEIKDNKKIKELALDYALNYFQKEDSITIIEFGKLKELKEIKK